MVFPPSSASRFLRRRRRPPCEVTSTSCSVGNPIATSCVDGKDEATGCGLLPSRVDRPILCLLNIVKQLIASPKRQPGNLWSFDFFLTIARTRTRKRTHTHKCDIMTTLDHMCCVSPRLETLKGGFHPRSTRTPDEASGAFLPGCASSGSRDGQDRDSSPRRLRKGLVWA